jgi:hypothetical protein
MAREASGTLSVSVDISERSTAVGVGDGTTSLVHRILYEKVLANGTSDGQIDRVHSEALSVTTTPTDYDLSGSLTSDTGAGTTSFVDLSLIIITNDSSSGDLQVGGDAASIPIMGAAADYILVKPGGIFVWYAPAGLAVTNSTADVLQIASSTGTVTGKMILAGRSA